MKLLNFHNNGRKAFLFTRNEKGEQAIIEDSEFFPFYYDYDPKGKYTSYEGTPLKRVIVSKPSDISKSAGLGAHGIDVPFKKTYMTHKIECLEKTAIKYIFIDIEIQANSVNDIKLGKVPITCITAYNNLDGEAFTWWLPEFPNEQKMLEDFCSYIKYHAPDIILGWNVSFDYGYLCTRMDGFAKKISPIDQSRYGDENVEYPAGISILDYMGLFKKVFMREASYALNSISQKYLDDYDWGETDFSKITEDIRDKNINDVSRMVKLENMFNLINYFDEIRRLTKVQWEDLYHNSAIIESLLQEEARKKHIVLPNKKENDSRGSFEGATRDVAKTGALFGVSKYDLTSAYPSMIVNFCLDFQNIKLEEEEGTVEVEGNFFKQNPDTLVPLVVKKILILKDTIKKELKLLKHDSPEQKEMKIKYDAIKAVVNSAFGVFGNQYFRLYDDRITSSITGLVRSLLMYTKEQVEMKGYQVVYWDTDSLFIETEDNLLEFMNKTIQDWGKEKYGKASIDLSYEFEGIFERLFLLAKCRYVGDLNTGKNIIREVKGVEMKRVSSTKYEAYFQEELINQVLSKRTKADIEEFVKKEKVLMRKLPLEEIAFPCKLSDKVYKNTPIHKRAVDNTRALFGTFEPRLGEVFYYTFVKGYGYDVNNKEVNVLAFQKGERKIDRSKIDFNELERRNILSKVENVYEAMGWKILNDLQGALF